MGHVTENVSRIAHNFMGCMSFDMTDEPYTTHSAVGVEGEILAIDGLSAEILLISLDRRSRGNGWTYK